MGNLIASAVFDSREEAERAVSELREMGVPNRSLSLMVQNGKRTTTTSGDGDTHEDHSNWLRGLLGGGALGAGLGVAALAIPGVGPLVAAGAIASSVVPEAVAIGAVAGAAVGSVNESLKKHGVDDDDIEYYGSSMKNGGVFVSVDSTGAIEPVTAQQILYRNGGHNSSQPRSSGADRTAGTTTTAF